MTQLVFDEDFLVRPIDEFHVENIKKLLQANPNSFATPFLLEVVPEDCPTKDNWSLDANVHSGWRYRVLGGNHGARAKLALWETYHLRAYKNIEAWVFAGLTKQQRNWLAWSHNQDQEYRKGMTNIDRIRACHHMFLEAGQDRSKELKFKCCDEIRLQYDPNNRDSLSKHDGMFQIAFRTGTLWELQNEIFTMWTKLLVKGQQPPANPKAGKSKSKGKAKPAERKSLKKLSTDMNLGHWRGLQGLTEKQIEHILRRVKLGMLSLDEMNKEGENLKKVVKTKKLFMQCARLNDWKACCERYPEETQYSVLHAWANSLTESVREVQFAFLFV